MSGLSGQDTGVPASPSGHSRAEPEEVSAPNALPEYGNWLPNAWDAYLEELVGYRDFHHWARLPATFRWHEFHARLASAIEASGQDGETRLDANHESATRKGDTHD